MSRTPEEIARRIRKAIDVGDRTPTTREVAATVAALCTQAASLGLYLSRVPINPPRVMRATVSLIRYLDLVVLDQTPIPKDLPKWR